MIQSLTGYGVSENALVRVEARSLNHRFLEISIKLPTILTKYEMEIRNLVKNRFQRGKIDIFVSVSQKQKTGRIYLNKSLAKQLYSAFIDLKKELSILGSIDISMFSNFKELFIYEEDEPDKDSLINTVKEALENLQQMRIREGEIIKSDIIEILEKLEKEIMNVEAVVDISYNNYVNGLKKRVMELLAQNSVDESKIFEQIVIYAQKTDIKEEVDRLKSHLLQFKETLIKGGPVGKKLDFLLQEMQRETNTLLAKTESLEIKNIAIEIKTNIERLKEQIQNIQ